MGLSSTTTASEGIQLCAFDLRRGQQEGQELDKILFFYPPECAFSKQLSVIGLSEGLITFTRIFSPDAACDAIETEKHTYVFHQAELDIWMVMVLDKTKDPEAVRRSSIMQEVLKQIHHLFVMFYGSVRALLDKQPSGVLARNHLYSFITDYFTDFLVEKKFQMPSFRDCLKEWGTIQMLTVGRDAAIEVQSLVTVLESSCAGNAMCKSLILFQDLLLSTTLSPDDTANLFSYAVMRFTPQALSSNSRSWTYSYAFKRSTSDNILSGSNSATNVSISGGRGYSSQDLSPGRHPEVFHAVRPLRQGIWSKGKDSFVVAESLSTEMTDMRFSPSIIRLRQTEEQMYLCVYQYKNLTVMLLIPVCSLVNGEQGLELVKQRLVENAYQKILKIDQKLSQDWGGENSYHVSGYRYLLLNSDLNISRASPPGKVLTLAKESLLALNMLREDVDLEKKRTKLDDPLDEKDLEICIRAKNNAWVIARVTRGKEFYMVLEKANETLLYAADTVEKFRSRYCVGVFDLD